MKKLLMSVIMGVAAILTVSPVFADETICASDVWIEEITVYEDHVRPSPYPSEQSGIGNDWAEVVVTATLPSGQTYTIPLSSNGNLLNTVLKYDLIAQRGGVIRGLSEVCVIYNLIPFSGRIIQVTNGGVRP